MIYLTKDELAFIFEFLSRQFARVEQIPPYQSEVLGCEKLWAILEQAQNDLYYPDLFDKATHFFVGINKGHFFSNGNKRLALVLAVVLCGNNGFELREQDKRNYQKILSELFPEFNSWTDFEDFHPTDFAMYNLSIMVADSRMSEITHDELKRRVRTFFVAAMDKVS